VTGHVRLAIPRELGGEASVGAGAGAIWVVVDGRTCTTCRLVGVDPRSLRVTARVPIMQGAAAVRVGAGAVWVTNTDHDVLQQVDPVRGRVVRTVTVGDLPRFLAVDRRGVWTLNQADGTVTRVARRTGRTTSIDAGMHGSGGDLAAGAGWLWARGTERLLTRIDPRGHQVVERYGPASARGAVTVGYGALWVSASDLRIVWRLPLRHVGRESPAT